MVRTIRDFIERWKEESDNTLKVINNLTDESLSRSVPGSRTLGRLANHLVETLSEFPHKLGLPIEEEFITHRSVAELTLAYQIASDRLLQAIADTWQDDKILKEEKNMYGEPWKIGVALYYLIAHQTHHRGQMTTIMRSAGLRVPGIYGPSVEEWKAMNMAPLE